mgnify:CR=1 FL=1
MKYICPKCTCADRWCADCLSENLTDRQIRLWWWQSRLRSPHVWTAILLPLLLRSGVLWIFSNSPRSTQGRAAIAPSDSQCWMRPESVRRYHEEAKAKIKLVNFLQVFSGTRQKYIQRRSWSWRFLSVAVEWNLRVRAWCEVQVSEWKLS